MKITFTAKSSPKADLAVLPVTETGFKKPGKAHVAESKALIAANPEFKAKPGEVVNAVVAGGKIKRFAMVGLGAHPKGMKPLDLEQAGGKLVAALVTMTADHIAVDFSDMKDLKAEQIAAFVNGMALRGYAFDTYRTKNKKRYLPDTVEIVTPLHASVKKAYADMIATTEGVHWARDLSSEPPNVLYPESFAQMVRKKLTPLGVKVTIIKDEELEKRGFGAMMAVGKASEQLPRLVLLEYKGKSSGKASKPVALIGKGITFDSGGYSIKPAEGMLEMKCDMSGAGAVAGAFYALAKAKANVHVVGALALAENMISDEGYRPSDILTSLSGQTIEVTNTDAEGRLVLADAMWHVQNVYKPRAMVDIATLTGAAMIALGEEYAGLFSNDEALAGKLETAAKETGDKIWRLPMDDAFDRAMDSPIADMKNASATRFGGSCTAAAFLNRFVQDGVKWAHVDMAPTMVARADRPLCPKGATGYGVRLLAEWVKSA